MTSKKTLLLFRYVYLALYSMFFLLLRNTSRHRILQVQIRTEQNSQSIFNTSA